MINESEIIELAKKCGAKPSSRITKRELILDDDQLLAFATEVRNRTFDYCIIELVKDARFIGAAHAILALKGDEK